MRRPRAGAGLAALALAVVAGLGACGVPEDAQPRRTPDADVPFGLLDTTTTSRPPVTTSVIAVP